jgi:hypothetical protein
MQIFESTSSVFSKLLRSCVLELCVVALPLLRIFVSVLTSENFLSKSSLFTPVTLISNNALVFNRGATGVNNDDFDKKFSLVKTLTNIRNSGNATTHSSNTQLLNSLLKTLNVMMLIETTRVVLNSRMRAKFGLKDIGFMIFLFINFLS